MRARLDVSAVAGLVRRAVDPDGTMPRRVRAGIEIPGRLGGSLGDELDEVMAYPQIDTPMYRPLVDRSSELFLPQLNLIEQNSLTLLETNQRFIEAYMVGLNHEFARELLWREYPTDQRGSVLPAVLGRLRASSTATDDPAGCASGCATSRRSTRGREARRSATTTTATREARPARSSSS